ncbi:sensor histidine kinase [Kribbella sandramycini]|uniref:Oxygen sensor histidine kinase NreB n=1 Tax=Kribbella sandramycini TaxID=60450 RepID=A0A7Y4KVF6_9ACTN|nr:sensor histidine kinase [Kribbella sandramycini]MBB6568111.1 signal transduction histidine kinase [Kribbella sandramycini]NOL39295.1 sensor histidine kinase [Kribbella sandramycini]
MVVVEASSERSEQFWARTLIGWHIVFWVLMAMLTVLGITSGLPDGKRFAALGAVVALSTAYQFVGRPAIGSRRRLPAYAYRLVLLASLMVLVALLPQAVFLMFIASAQIWLLSEDIREGAGLSLLLVVCCGTAQLWSAGWGWEAFWAILPWMLVSLVVSLVFGIWIERVIAQSEQRAVLIDQLHAAQAELAEVNHSAGVMAERERMAREIHDTLAQGMTSIVMLSQTAAAELSRNGAGDGVAARLGQIEATARENLAEARALVAAFTPIALSEATLSEVLRRQAERFTAETGVNVAVALDLDDAEVAVLTQAQQVVLLRSAQEALANVRKHARATQVQITLGITDAGVAIAIRDDGAGFSTAAPSPGFGLAAMRGRVEESGGTVQVESAPGRGTTVQVRIPTSQETL